MFEINSSMSSLTEKAKAFAKTSVTAKIFTLGFILLVLMIPYFMVSGLQNARSARCNSASSEISSKWGGKQLVTAPIMQYQVHEKSTHSYFVLPEDVKVEASVVPEIRYRGIYEVMLYKSQIKIQAKFIIPPAPNGYAYTDRGFANVLFRVTDIKGIEKIDLKVDGKDVERLSGKIITAVIPFNAKESLGREVNVTAEIQLNGFQQLVFSPIGRNFEMTMTSPWAHPSFIGDFLPGSREITADGFKAKWLITDMNRNFPQKWTGSDLNSTLSDFPKYNIYSNDSFDRSRSYCVEDCNGQRVGVAFVQPANAYQQVDRVMSYAFLVIAIVLVAFLIGERLTKMWIHPIQYFFVGLSLVVFYVLLLALAEHIAFGLSYLISTVVIATMTTLYAKMIFAKGKAVAAGVLGGVILLAYLLVYILIQLEDYALLVGSLILLILLGVLMYTTGNMNKDTNSIE